MSKAQRIGPARSDTVPSARGTLLAMSRVATIACLMLIASLVLGPLAMALDGCAAMGMCEVPCGLTYAAMLAAPTLSTLQPVADVLAAAPTVLQSPFSSSIEPPPKLALSSL